MLMIVFEVFPIKCAHALENLGGALSFIFEKMIYSCDDKAEFAAAISPVFNVTNYSNVLIWS